MRIKISTQQHNELHKETMKGKDAERAYLTKLIGEDPELLEARGVSITWVLDNEQQESQTPTP